MTRAASKERGPGAGAIVIVCLAGLLFTMIGAWVLYAAAGEAYHSIIEVRGWQPVDAVVVSSEMKDESTEESKGYSFKVIYRYEVDGREYTSDRYLNAGMASAMKSDAERAVREYPAGKRITAYVNPKDPSQAALTREVPVLGLVAVGFLGLMFAGMGLGVPALMLSTPLWRKRRARTIASGREITAEFENPGVSLLIFSVVWNVFTWILVSATLLSGSDTGWGVRALMAVFVLLGVLLLWGGASGMRKRRPYSALTLSIDPAPLEAGQSGQWEIADRTGRIASMAPMAHLVYRQYGSEDEDKARGWQTPYEEEAPFEASTAGGTYTISGKITLPAKPRRVSDDETGRRFWAIRLRIGKAEGYFPLPVA